jgi:phage terminase small subunit
LIDGETVLTLSGAKYDAKLMQSERLTVRQQQFVREYLVDLSAAKAAVRSGYSKTSAHVTASRMLRRAAVRGAIQAELEKRFGITKLTIAEELAAVAFHNVGDVVSWSKHNLRVRPSNALTDDQRKAVIAVRQSKGRIEVQFADRLRALELLAHVLGLMN